MKTKNLKFKMILFLTVIISASVIMTGCSTSIKEESFAEPSGTVNEKITIVLDWVPNTNHTGIYVALEKGYYKEAGIEADIVQPTEGGSADLIAAGKGEFGISYQEQVTYARTSSPSLPVVAIAAILPHNTSGFASMKEKNIVSPKDFENKIYGGWGSPVEDALLKGLMEKYDADFSKLKIVNIGASDFITSVQRDVDFSWIYYGWDGIASEVKNFEINFMLLQDFDERLDFYTPVIIASEETLKNRKDLVKKFLDATRKGYLYSIENPEDSAEILLENAPELDREIVLKSQQYLSSKYMPESGKWGFMEEDIWKNFSEWMFENQLIARRLDYENAYTNEFLK
ncbi:MAG TPA: ABC transporter substrate-binding protein [Actinobacteria bacterium]|nr:ABC transporter substrate-binding protein [Actinomycetota bacterium]